MSDQELQEYMDYVLPLVKESGKILLEIKSAVRIKNKEEVCAYWDPVTIYDKKIEENLISVLKKKYPNHKFIAEEESSVKDQKLELTNAPTWIIDPIDGTANFSKLMPITCISVGLTINQDQVLGVVYNPYMNELFTAIKGKGAFLNEERIFTSGKIDVSTCYFNYEISIARRNKKLFNLYMYRIKHLIRIIPEFRVHGSVVLGLCYVACGRVDAHQCDGLYPWDAAAGTLIVREAGGTVLDTTGKEKFDLMEPNHLAAATNELAEKLLEIEREADQDRMDAAKNHQEFKP